MELYRVGVKVFAHGDAAVPLSEFIPVFHRWIQQKSLDDLLIDVADYSHVHQGPGIVLVAHEGNYSIDEGRGRRGLAYYSKRPLAGNLAEKLSEVCRKAVVASRLLESESDAAPIRFSGGEFEVFANDRLAAPNSDQTLSEFRPALDGLAAKLYPGSHCTFHREPDQQERFSVRVGSNSTVSLEQMLEKLSG